MPMEDSDGDSVEIAARLCEFFEGFYARPYLCPAGVPTIGYGFTRYPDGRSVSLLDPPISREHAKFMLRWFIRNRYLPDCKKLAGPNLYGERLGAITDFVYNLGTAAFKASTLRKRLLSGQWAEVPKELRKWVRGGGRILPGLVKRRNAEAAYFE